MGLGEKRTARSNASTDPCGFPDRIRAIPSCRHAPACES